MKFEQTIKFVDKPSEEELFLKSIKKKKTAIIFISFKSIPQRYISNSNRKVQPPFKSSYWRYIINATVDIL